MKLKKLHEDYCPTCGGWDKEQRGGGHRLGCPVVMPGTKIKKTANSYRDFVLGYYKPPIPSRNSDWSGAHKDYDGPEDNRLFYGPSNVKKQIDEWYDEQLL